MSDTNEPKPRQLDNFINGETNIEKMRNNTGDRVFTNRYYDKKLLNKEEALDLINHLSMMLLIDECR